MVIMDDVVANGGTFQSARTPYSLETTRDTLGQLARLHAATWGGARVRRPRLARTARRRDGRRVPAGDAAVAPRRRPGPRHRARAARRRQADPGGAPRRPVRDDVRDPRRHALGEHLHRRAGPRLLARLADRPARQLGHRHQLPPGDRPRHRRPPRPRGRPPPPLPRRADRPGRAGAVVGSTRGSSTPSGSPTATCSGSSRGSARARSCSSTSRASPRHSPTTTRSDDWESDEQRYRRHHPVRGRVRPRGGRRPPPSAAAHALARAGDGRRLVAGRAARVRPGPRRSTGATGTTSTRPRRA